ncbi:lipase family protein [Herbiconiux sp. CPCC 205763]|uniref:Lipase family protein n=1 Tax=Herbiconiux aconitum TaxID=2970913 RepID=A0ABT2GV49_9MICO|nr:lipase family protein [Herbiconiux aconitum]MCS5718771.1 lipase family protein [Herbiconiux aconitum]
MGFFGVDFSARLRLSKTVVAAASLFVLAGVAVTGCTSGAGAVSTASPETVEGGSYAGGTGVGEVDPTTDGQFGIPDFYTPPSPLPKGEHGDIIDSEEVPAPDGARAWRILYLSELHDGTPVAASGFVVAPEGDAPEGGRKVVAWAHGTEGGGRNCAPSLAPKPAVDLVDFFTYESPFQQDVGVPALTEMLDAGYVVVATDYQGLGTPGVQQYTVLDSETNNVWDSVKAAQQIKATKAGDDMVVLGWSQGGGASVWMAQDTSYGAPLNLLGAAALAPAADNGPQFAGQVAPGPENSTSVAHAAALQLNVYRGFLAAYPELKASDVVTKEGEEALAAAGVQCVNHLAYVFSSNLTTPFETLIQPTTPADWQKRLDENTPGYVAPTAPLLVMQGTADTVVNPNGTTQYYERACGFGQPVEYTIYNGATHQTIPGDAKGEYTAWIADRFTGEPAPTTCAPAGSTQTAPTPLPTPSPLPTPAATAAPAPAN